MSAIIAPGLANKVEVSLYNGEIVVVHLSQAQEFLPFAPAGAVDIATRMMAFAAQADIAAAQMVVNSAMFLIDHVYEVRNDLKPVGGAAKHELIERHRRTLTTRMEHILKTERERKRVSHHELAKGLVDKMLQEVFS